MNYKYIDWSASFARIDEFNADSVHLDDKREE